MEDVLRWIDRHNGAPALEILASGAGEEATATDLLAGIVATDSREQSGIWSTASGVLAAYRTEGALASTRTPPLNLEEFCSRSEHSLRVLDGTPSAAIRTARRGGRGRRARRDLRTCPLPRHNGPPTLLALDEVANIAPIPDLPAMVSEGAGQGLLVLACLQDLSQARGRWGTAADGFLSLFGTTVVLRGIGDTATLRDISALAGDRDVTATTISRTVGRWGRIRPSTSVGSARQARLPVDAVAHGTPGHALVLGPHKEVEEVVADAVARVTLPGASCCRPCGPAAAPSARGLQR